jgi:hypothetical protein
VFIAAGEAGTAAAMTVLDDQSGMALSLFLPLIVCGAYQRAMSSGARRYWDGIPAGKDTSPLFAQKSRRSCMLMDGR